MQQMRKQVFKAALDRLGTDAVIEGRAATLRVLRDLEYEKSSPGEFQSEVAERRYRCFSDALDFDTKTATMIINGLNYSIARTTFADDDGLITYLYLK